MNGFWSAFARQFRECGRNATLFLIAMAVVCVALPIAAKVALYLAGKVSDSALADYWHDYWHVIVYAVTVLCAFWIYRILRRPRPRTRFSPLSRDEIRAARSKLMKSRSPDQV
jgi:hypothetical protein